MSSGVSDPVATLAAMSPAQISGEWERVHGAPAPTIAASLLARDLAHRVQLIASGGPDKRSERRIRELVASAGEGAARRVGGGVALGGGTQLLREWGGKTHRVTVEPDGRFVYAGQTWLSLSAIAREITGARWSGPRFFGTRS